MEEAAEDLGLPHALIVDRGLTQIPEGSITCLGIGPAQREDRSINGSTKAVVGGFLQVSEVDHLLGMEVYATQTLGVGGTIKTAVEDFIVEEVLVDGSKATVDGASPPRVLGSTSVRQRFCWQ